jgi:hypothetical protein
MIMLEDYSQLRQNFNSSILKLPQADIVKSSLLKYASGAGFGGSCDQISK